MDVGGLDDAGLTRLRRDKIGFVFQSFNLVPTLTAGENITLPADLAGTKVDRDWHAYLVKQLGIGDRLTHRPSELSGGQQQRISDTAVPVSSLLIFLVLSALLGLLAASWPACRAAKLDVLAAIAAE